jgi:hypothetical protein
MLLPVANWKPKCGLRPRETNRRKHILRDMCHSFTHIIQHYPLVLLTQNNDDYFFFAPIIRYSATWEVAQQVHKGTAYTSRSSLPSLFCVYLKAMDVQKSILHIPGTSCFCDSNYVRNNRLSSRINFTAFFLDIFLCKTHVPAYAYCIRSCTKAYEWLPTAAVRGSSPDLVMWDLW